MSERGRLGWPFGRRDERDPRIPPISAAGQSDSAAVDELGAALDLIAPMLRQLGEVPVLPDDPAAGELRAEWER
jgi:hypothetical protein